MTGDGGGSEIAVVLLDTNGSIVDAHASCAETFGWRRDELLGKDISLLLQYGRDLLMSQLQLLQVDEAEGHTSFSLRVLARKKDQQQFSSRATVRRFQELECWTVAFYRTGIEGGETNLSPTVSAEEISLAKKAMEQGTAVRESDKKQRLIIDEKKGESMPVGRLWRNSRLLFGSREERPAEGEDSTLDSATEKQIEQDASVLAAHCREALAPRNAEPMPETSQAGSAGYVETPTHPFPKQIEPSAAPARPPLPSPAPKHESPSPSAESLAQLARLKAELEKERGERNRIEQRASSLGAQVQALHLQLSEGLNLERENQERVASLEQELRSTQDLLAETKANFEAERLERRAAEDHLSITRDLNARMEENLSLFEKSRLTFESTQQELQSQIERVRENLGRAEKALDREQTEKLRAEQALANALREYRDSEGRKAAEIARLNTAVQGALLDKSRLDESVLRHRSESLEIGRQARARVAGIQSDFSRVLQHITGTTRELLQSQLTDEQKCVIEALLQDVIALESSLEQRSSEPAAENAENAPSEVAVS